MEKNQAKARLSTQGKHLNPLPLHTAFGANRHMLRHKVPQGVASSTSIAFLIVAQMASLFGWLYSLHAAFSSRCFTFRASSNYWDLFCIFGFIATDSCTALSWAPFLISKVFPCSLGGSLPDTTTLTFCMLANPAPHGQLQRLLQLEKQPDSLGPWIRTQVTAY